MPSRLRVLVALLLVSIVALAARTPAASDDRPRLLFISIDGLMPSTYTSAGPAKIPTLRRVMAQGVYADGVIGVMPTLTYPSHTTLVTGVPPAIHGIYDNRIADPEGTSNMAWYWYARELRVPTLATAAHAASLRAGAVSWPVSVGLDIDYNVPEFWRSNHPESLTLLRALSSPPDIIDAAEIARGERFPWPQADRERTDMAKFIIRAHHPHVMLVHLFDTDSAAHDYGPGSPEVLAATERVDGYVGELLDTLRVAGLADRTHVAIVSDHGFLPTTTNLNVNYAFAREGLLTVNERGRVTSWQAYFHPAGGAGFIYLQNPHDAALRDRVMKILETLARDPANGLRKIFTREELDRMGSHPDASLAIDVQDGFYTSGGTEALLSPDLNKGGHGYDPTRPALRASFIGAGPAIAKRGSLGTIRMTQIAPTFARILGVGLSPLADQALTLGKNDAQQNR